MTGLESLQKKIGVKPDGSFGPKTLIAMKSYFNLTDEQISHFCGQVAHETGGFQLYTENLNYSASGLRGIFGKYFPNNLSETYARQPVKIASRVYANRMGNGDETSQDGWKFRGRGALQTTGKSNYQLFADSLKKQEIMTNPDLLATDYAFESAIYFFDKNKLWNIADKGVNDGTILSMTKKINGGTNGLSERISLTKRYYTWIKE
jgi:putative chitinase